MEFQGGSQTQKKRVVAFVGGNGCLLVHFRHKRGFHQDAPSDLLSLVSCLAPGATNIQLTSACALQQTIPRLDSDVHLPNLDMQSHANEVSSGDGLVCVCVCVCVSVVVVAVVAFLL